MAQAQRRTITIVSEKQMLQLGLETCGFVRTTNETSDESRFQDLFGACPGAAVKLFKDLQTEDLGDAKIKKINLKNFFMTLYYARGYGIETRVMTVFNIKCPKNFRMHVWQYLAAIQALKKKKVNNSND
jgi:hypothetical protein